MLDASLSQPDEQRSAALPGARWAMALLLCMNLVNYVDRQVLAAVEPEIRESLLLSHDSHDTNVRTKTGLLSSAFLVSYMLTAPLVGLVAQRWSRWKLMAVGVVFWSLATGASGLAGTFTALLLTRCFVGVGEGVYGPIAPAVLSDFFPLRMRGRVMAWFYMAIPVGGALGYALGGEFARLDRAQQSWRWAFYVLVVPGILLSLWSLAMREPPPGAADKLAAPSRRARLKDYLALFSTRSYVLNTLGMTAMTFSLGALAFWMPDYLESHRVAPLLGVEPRTMFGIIAATAGLAGTLCGGMLGDGLRNRFPGSYFQVSAVGMALCVPCTLLFLAVPFPAAWIFVFLAVFFLFLNTGPSNTILANVVHPAMRSAGFAVNILIIHVFGDVISPPIVGAIADRYSLVYGFSLVAAFMALAAVLWAWGSRHLQPDTAAAPLRLA
jgi:MFS transporter, Spinster family, sphingosine-1-phosphate transporter